jgi:hypothetical protein
MGPGSHIGFQISAKNKNLVYHKTDLNQTGQKCSLDGHIQDFCFGTDRKSNMAARANNVF